MFGKKPPPLNPAEILPWVSMGLMAIGTIMSSIPKKVSGGNYCPKCGQPLQQRQAVWTPQQTQQTQYHPPHPTMPPMPQNKQN